MGKRSQKLALAGVTLPIAEAAMAAMHAGSLGAIVGVGAALAAYSYGDDIIEKFRQVQRISPMSASPKSAEYQQSLAYRLLNGKSVRAEPTAPVGIVRQAPLSDRQETTRILTFGEDEQEIIPPSYQQEAGLFRFSDLLKGGWRPSINQIFVGRSLEDGKDIFVKAKDLCHVALSGKTGGGKGSLMRLLMVQLCYIGAHVLLLNPHYMKWVVADDGPEWDEDWTPFEGVNPRITVRDVQKPYLELPPARCADFEPIQKYLEWTITRLLEKRRADGREGGMAFKPYFLVLDEWPSIVAEVADAPTNLAKLLREGRKYGIFVIVASQDFQVKTIGMDGGSVRKCLLTCYYTGGDATTAKELLLLERGDTVPETRLGKGVVMLRCVATENKAVLARVPFVDNEALYLLLGPSTYKQSSASYAVHDIDTQELRTGLLSHEEQNTDVLREVSKRDTRRKADDIDIKAAIALWNSGFNSRAKLAAALGIAENQAAKLMERMEIKQSDGRMDGDMV